jgi:cytochrome P450
VSRIANALTADYLARWLSAGDKLTVPRELSRLTIDIVSQAMLGHCFSAEESVRFVDLFFAYHQRAAPLLLMLAGRNPRALDKLVRQLGLEEIGADMRALIATRFLTPIAAGEPAASRAPFAKGLLEALNGARESMLDEIAVMLLAGHETTAATLSWLLWELAGNPANQDAVAQLLRGRAATGPEGELWQDVAPAALRGALINETLRLYPPIAFFLRETTDALTLRDKPLRAGDFIVTAPWTLHRHLSRWRAADRFCPQRWLAAPDRPPATAFLPFGFGARSCPGQRFAYLEMHAILHQLLTALPLHALAVSGAEAARRPYLPPGPRVRPAPGAPPDLAPGPWAAAVNRALARPASSTAFVAVLMAATKVRKVKRLGTRAGLREPNVTAPTLPGRPASRARSRALGDRWAWRGDAE